VRSTGRPAVGDSGADGVASTGAVVPVPGGCGHGSAAADSARSSWVTNCWALVRTT